MNGSVLKAVGKMLSLLCVVMASASGLHCAPAGKPGAVPDGLGARPELVIQYSSSSNLLYATFAANAPILAAYSEQGAVGIWNTRTWTLERAIVVGGIEDGRMYNAKPIALSPDGATFAYLSVSGEVQLWDVKSGVLRMKLPKPVGTAIAVIWSPDGRYVVGGGKYVRLWEAKSGRLVRTFSGSGDVAFSRDGKKLATAGVSGFEMDTDAHLFNVATGKRILTLRDGSEVMAPIAISPDGKLIATGGEDPHWKIGELPRGEDGYELAPTEASVSHDLKVKVWNARTGKRVRLLPGHNNLDGGTRVLQFSPDSRTLFSSGPGYSAFWDVRTGKRSRKFATSLYSDVLSADGGMVAVAGDALRVLSTTTGKELFASHASPAPIQALAFSPDGDMLASADQWTGTSLRLWDIKNGRLVRALPGPPPDIHDVSFLARGRVMSNSFNGAYMWDVVTGKLIGKWKGPTEKDELGSSEQKWALLAPDGTKQIAESGTPFTKAFKAFDVATGKLLWTFPVHGGGSLGAFSPDGRHVAITGIISRHIRQPAVKIVNLETGAVESELIDTADYISALVFSPDRSVIAGTVYKSAMNEYTRITPPDKISREGMDKASKQPPDYSIGIWDRASGKRLRTIMVGSTSAAALAFSPDGRTLAAAVPSGIVMYNAETGDKMGSIEIAGVMTTLAYSPDGSRIAAGDEEGSIRLWDAGTRRLLITMVGLPADGGGRPSLDWYAYTPDGFYDWNSGAARLLRWRLRGGLYPASSFEKQLRRRDLLKQTP